MDGTSRLTIDLVYGQDFTLRVSDDGIGIDVSTAEQGKAGYFGLLGMRVRTIQIGGKLEVVSSAALGARIVLWAPGKTVFRATLKEPPSLMNQIKSWRRKAPPQ